MSLMTVKPPATEADIPPITIKTRSTASAPYEIEFRSRTTNPVVDTAEATAKTVSRTSSALGQLPDQARAAKTAVTTKQI